tara:strand:+ start:32 stop:1057 length:1026 start_codon:yes stop_codon:yes gene_type:complete
MNIGICGLGRIGKTLLRIIFEKKNNINVKIIKDLKNDDQSEKDAIHNLSYLLQNDSTYGIFPKKISIIGNNKIKIGKSNIECNFSKNITDVNWKNHKLDLLIEASGNQQNIKNVKKLISKKLKNILITRSAKEADFTLVYGVNENKLNKNKHKTISLSTCTGNAAAPFLKIVDEELVIQNGFLTTIHPVLSSEKSLDGPNRLPQLGRASKNVKLINSAISKSVIEVLPNLNGKIAVEAMSYRIPTDIVSSVYGVLKIKKKLNKNQFLEMLEKKINPKILGICYGSFEKEKVSLDYLKDSRSSILSSFRTSVNDDLLSFHLWHDNEYAYCKRIYDAILQLSR